MMRNFWRKLLSIGTVVLGVTSMSHAQSLDGWGSNGGPGSPTLTSQTAFGVTLHTHALDSANPQGGFWGPSTGNLIPTQTANLEAATTLSLDLTLIGTQLNGGSGNFNGFAQSNEMAIQLFGGPINMFIQESWNIAGISDSTGQSAQWDGVDGTRTLTWNLTDFTATDPTTGNVEDVSQILQNNPGISSAQIDFVEQTGSGTGTVGPAHFYFDDVQLNGLNGSIISGGLLGDFESVPEPASLGLIGLIVPFLAMRHRRVRGIPSNSRWF